MPAVKLKTPLGPTGTTTACRVRDLRLVHNWTYEELSRRLTDVGRPIAPLGLRRIEARDRRVDTDDLVALAAVLGVTPSTLLLPPTIEGNVELTGVGTVSAERAWTWIDGQGPLRHVEDDGSAEVEFQLRARPQGRRQIWSTSSAK